MDSNTSMAEEVDVLEDNEEIYFKSARMSAGRAGVRLVNVRCRALPPRAVGHHVSLEKDFAYAPHLGVLYEVSSPLKMRIPHLASRIWTTDISKSD